MLWGNLFLFPLKFFFGGIDPELANGDFNAHYSRVSGLMTGKYPPLTDVVGKPFSVSPEIFYYAGLLISFLLIPALLVRLTGNWLTALFYFATSSPWNLSFG